MEFSLIESCRARINARMLCKIALGCVWMTLASQIAVPLPFTTVPITLGPQAALFLGMFIGSWQGAASVALWAWMGLNGAPVFSGWSAFIDPTTGYIVGYILGAWMMGRLMRWVDSPSPTSIFCTALVAHLPIYLCGLSWLALYVPIGKLLAFGFWPFLPGLFIKTALMSLAAALVKRWEFWI